MTDVRDALRQLIQVDADALPNVALVRQRFRGEPIEDLDGAVRAAFQSVGAVQRLRPGSRVAITAGSRGIDRIAELTRAIVDGVRRCGAEPFVVAAMGSHGGATSEGQRRILEDYGLTEGRLGCSVSTSMATRPLGRSESGCEVFCDEAAFAADAIVVVGRVKPHSVLTGELGSGLCKMSAIGLGKRDGADALHRLGLQRHLESAARAVLERAPVAFGIAVVENAYDRIEVVEGAEPAAFFDVDRRLLRRARANLPNVPFDPIDVLIVDRFGKDVSGAGMDPNVVGMWRRNGGPPDREIGRIVALELSPESHGNAIGIGMADITTHAVASAIDPVATYTNALTSAFLWGVKMPLAVASSRDAALLACKPYDRTAIRLVRIPDTAHLELMYVSEALLADVSSFPHLELLGKPRSMRFTKTGDFADAYRARRAQLSVRQPAVAKTGTRGS